MILLKKVLSGNEYFNFDKILIQGYKITEGQNEIAKKQMANGKRKKIVTAYNDVVIEINLGCFDGNTLYDYLQQLTDGEFQYYSLNDRKMKNANFIVTLPQQGIESATDEVFVSDFTVILEKSSDVL